MVLRAGFGFCLLQLLVLAYLLLFKPLAVLHCYNAAVYDPSLENLLIVHTNIKGTAKPACPCYLTSAFVFRYLDCKTHILSLSETFRLELVAIAWI